MKTDVSLQADRHLVNPSHTLHSSQYILVVVKLSVSLWEMHAQCSQATETYHPVIHHAIWRRRPVVQLRYHWHKVRPDPSRSGGVRTAFSVFELFHLSIRML